MGNGLLLVREWVAPVKIRLPAALVLYAALALTAQLTLDDLRVRTCLWLLLGAFAIKTWIAHNREKNP
jgi:hypothetical protein